LPNPLVGPETSPFNVGIFNLLGPFSGAGRLQKAHIILSAYSVQVHSANNSAVATASIKGNYTGTPTWSITDASGALQIDSSTGAITVLDVTKITYAKILPVTVAVSGTDPDPHDFIVNIEVTAAGIMYQQMLSV
jgi:hypothetical protein